MRTGDSDAVAVMSEGRLVGIITNRDLQFERQLPNRFTVFGRAEDSARVQESNYVALFDDHSGDIDIAVRRHALGLRWDYETPITERYNRMVRGFAFDQASPLAAQVPGLNLKGGLLFAGSSGESRYSFNPDRTGF